VTVITQFYLGLHVKWQLLHNFNKNLDTSKHFHAFQFTIFFTEYNSLRFFYVRTERRPDRRTRAAADRHVFYNFLLEMRQKYVSNIITGIAD